MDKKLRKKVIIYSLIFFVIFMSAFWTVTYYLGENERENETSKLITAEEGRLTAEKNIYSDEIHKMGADVLFLADMYSYYSDTEGGLEDIVEVWEDFSFREKVYDQIRYIDAAGDEVIRIDFNDALCEQVDEKELQNKSGRYYFTDTMAIDEGQIFVSKLDLNIENGEIEQPIKPMIRMGTPVFNEDGSPAGIVIVNFSAEYLLKYISGVDKLLTGDNYVVNSNGYYIYNGTDPEAQWTFMYEGLENEGFFADYPEAWAQMHDSHDGVIWTEDGCFIYETLSLHGTGSPYDDLADEDTMIAGEGALYAISHLHEGLGLEETLFLTTGERLCRLWFDTWFILFLFVPLSGLIAFIIVGRKVSAEQTKYFSEYDTMTGVLNRRAGLKLLEIRYKRARETGDALSICFADVNGLKQVNDQIGHDAGDDMITSVVEVMKEQIRQTDFIVRMGGDEFLIVLIKTGTKTAETVWKRIAAEFERINSEEDRPYNISVSHGIETFSTQADEKIDDVIAAADQKMYLEKREIKKNFDAIRR